MKLAENNKEDEMRVHRTVAANDHKNRSGVQIVKKKMSIILSFLLPVDIKVSIA